MLMPTLKPRVGSDLFRLQKETLHSINLCRHDKGAEFVSYLQTLDIRERTEVYGRTIAWLADNASYEMFTTIRRLVWSSGLRTCQVQREGTNDD
jgi:hypothetical protein